MTLKTKKMPRLLYFFINGILSIGISILVALLVGYNELTHHFSFFVSWILINQSRWWEEGFI